MLPPDDITHALDDILNQTFPNTDQGYPHTPLTRRAQSIMHTVSWILEGEGYPVLTAYNFHQVGKSVEFNVRHPAQDNPADTITSAKWIEFDNVMSDTALVTQIAQYWRDDFNGVIKTYAMKRKD